MKRYFSLFAILIFLLIIPLSAHAGIWDSVKGAISAQAWSVLVGAGIGALGMFGAGYALWGKVVKECLEVIISIVKATRTKSEGGRRVTAKEMESIIKEALEVHPAVVKALAKKGTQCIR